MINIVHNCDCNDFMQDIPDNYYDLAIVDPPYGINIGKKGKVGGDKPFGSKKFRHGIDLGIVKANEYKSFDDSKIPDKKYFNELFRISENQIIWGGNYFIEFLKNTSCFIIWDKNKSGFFADGELAWTSFKTCLKIYKYKWNGMLQEDMKNKEFRIHPTQKPVALYKWLLKNYAKPGDKIFDSHVGSGSSRIAACELGFDFEGCELDLDYFNAQELRFMEFKKKFHNEFYIPEEENYLFK